MVKARKVKNEKKAMKKGQSFVEKVKLSGITVLDLLDQKLIEEFKKEGLNPIPFMLLIDLGAGDVVLITHGSPEEVESKTIHIECKGIDPEKESSNVEKILNILRKMVK